MIGSLIGNYKIKQKIGEGGMGAVYLGVDTMLDREVAIKVLHQELASQESVVGRFRSEAVTLARLNHPNIAMLYTMLRQTNGFYMILEFVRGETLDSILQRRGALPSQEAIPVFCQVLDGIDHAHELGIIHRDIKPANIMLTEKGSLKVLDFGIARLLGSAKMTRAGSIIGTLEYMSPEQVRGRETDARSDIYSLGMMLYEILTGRMPFETENEFELMRSQTEISPQLPRLINPAIPVEIEAAIMKAIDKSPDNRFQTAGEFREALLDAGFAASGTMRRTVSATHNQPEHFSAQNTMPLPVSNDATLPIPLIKPPNPTRLANVATNNELKETRFTPQQVNSVENVTNDYSVNEETSPTFLSRLTWIHYAGLSAVAFVLLGIPAIGVFAYAIFQNTSEKVVATPTPTATRPVSIETPKLQPTSAPEQASSTPVPVYNPISVAPSTPKETTKSDELVQTPSAPKPVDRSEKVEQPKPKPTPAIKKPTPAQPKESSTQRKNDLKCRLTGDC